MPTYNKPVSSGPPRANAPRPKFAAMNLPKATPPTRQQPANAEGNQMQPSGPPMNQGPPPMNQPPQTQNAPPQNQMAPPMNSGPPPMGSGSGPRPMARGSSNVGASSNVNEADCQEVYALLQPFKDNYESVEGSKKIG